MIQSKEYIIHQIANDIKTHIGRKYKDKPNRPVYSPQSILDLSLYYSSDS